MAASEPVPDASGGEEQAGEHDGVGGDDPLQLRRARTEIVDKTWHGHVDDGVIDRCHEEGKYEHSEHSPTIRVACVGVAEGLRGRTAVHGETPCSVSMRWNRNATGAGWLLAVTKTTICLSGAGPHWLGPLRYAEPPHPWRAGERLAGATCLTASCRSAAST